jgi:glycosyltransferase involved in cell wall biosynthesis
MKVLIALPPNHKPYRSVNDIINGQHPVNGTDGSMMRLAALLAEAGIDVSLSTASPVACTSFQSITHSTVRIDEYDCLILHHAHWNGKTLTFGNHALPKTILWLHLEVQKPLIYQFLRQGGYRVICPSQYLAKWYRMLPNWWNRVVVIPNPYCPLFHPIPRDDLNPPIVPRLLFIAALGIGKGLIELTQIWAYLAQQNVSLELAIAGSINLYNDQVAGASGLAEPKLENTIITPWLDSLPKHYQPKFLGSLAPHQLKVEIVKSWAVIVNPCKYHPETFCGSAVEAQACDRSVFSVSAGALPETIYHDTFNTLAEDGAPESVAKRIMEGLSNPEQIAENGRLAGVYVRKRFSSTQIVTQWILVLNGKPIENGLPKLGDSVGGLIRDLIRWSRTWRLVNQSLNLWRT